MALRKQLESCAWLLAIVAVLVPPAEAANVYKYVNKNGHTVFDSNIPPEYVDGGYTILNEKGIVIQVVPRAPTSAELAARAAREERLRLAEEARKAQEEADKMLLRLYRSTDDIASKRDDKISLLDIQRTALAAQELKAAEEVDRLRQVVDKQTAQNKEASPETLDLLRIQRAEESRLSSQITRIDSDIAAIRAEAESEMQRLSELLGSAE